MSTIPHSIPVHSNGLSSDNARLERFAWGVFLLMSGGLWLLPPEEVPPGAWAIGTGLILVTLNTVRHFKGIAVSRFTLVLGILAVAGGLADINGVRLPLLALCLLVVGGGIVLRAAFPART